MKNVFERCPQFKNEKYTLRFISKNDSQDLLKVYSDNKAVPLFNSDNCGGDDFHYTTEIRMKKAIDYWISEYDKKGFVRWTIVDNYTQEAIGTIELFHRNASDYFTECGLLRLDIRSDYEKSKEIKNILSLIIFPAFEMFWCDKIAIKAIPEATERIRALVDMGFLETNEKLIGHDGTAYTSYFVRKK